MADGSGPPFDLKEYFCQFGAISKNNMVAILVEHGKESEALLNGIPVDSAGYINFSEYEKRLISMFSSGINATLGKQKADVSSVPSNSSHFKKGKGHAVDSSPNPYWERDYVQQRCPPLNHQYINNPNPPYHFPNQYPHNAYSYQYQPYPHQPYPHQPNLYPTNQYPTNYLNTYIHPSQVPPPTAPQVPPASNKQSFQR